MASQKRDKNLLTVDKHKPKAKRTCGVCGCILSESNDDCVCRGTSCRAFKMYIQYLEPGRHVSELKVTAKNSETFTFDGTVRFFGMRERQYHKQLLDRWAIEASVDATDKYLREE